MHHTLEKGNVPSQRWHRSSRTTRPTLSLLLLVVAVVCFIVLRQNHPSSADVLSTSTVQDRISKQLAASKKARQLDAKYAGHLILKHSNYEDAHQAMLISDTNSTSKYSSTIVMGRMSNEEERVQWVHNKLLNIDKTVIYLVDDPSTPGPHLVRNHGRESAVYMDYIIENYDSLPDITFFWHNDEQVWHNNLLLAWNSVETINRMDRENIMRSGYVPSRCDHWPGCPAWIRFNPSRAEDNLDPHRLEEMFVPELFQRLFPGTTEFPPYFAGTCCSQFAVSRDAIRSRSKNTYEAILDWILEYQYDDRSGMVMEYVWPYIFTGRGALCPAMERCYCKTYGICIEEDEDVTALSNWNDLRTRREEVKWQLNFYEEALESAQKMKEDTGASEDDVVAVEKNFSPEIERISAELERLSNNTWNAREQIIKHWKLPAPPTGW